MSNDSQIYNPNIFNNAHPDCIFADHIRKEWARKLLEEKEFRHLDGTCILWKGQTRPKIWGDPNLVQRRLGFAQIDTECPVRGSLIVHYSWLAVSCTLKVQLEATIQDKLAFLNHSDIQTGMATNVELNVAARMKSLSIIDQHDVLGGNQDGKMKIRVTHQQTNDIEVVYTGAAHRKSSSLAIYGANRLDFKIDKKHRVKVEDQGNTRRFLVSVS